MKKIKRIHCKGIDFEVGKDGVVNINVFEQKKNGNILYQVIKNGKSIFVSAYDMKEEYQDINIEDVSSAYPYGLLKGESE